MKTLKKIGLLICFIYFQIMVAGVGAMIYYAIDDVSPTGLYKYGMRITLAGLIFFTASFCSFGFAVTIMPRQKPDFNFLRHPIKFIKLSSASLN